MTTFDRPDDRPLQLQALHTNLEKLDRTLKKGDTEVTSAIQLLCEICDVVETIKSENDVTTRLQGETTASPESTTKVSCLHRWLTRSQINVAVSPNSMKEDNQEKSFLENTLVNQRNDKGDTLAHTAATYHSRREFLDELINRCPSILFEERKGPLNGQTPLHVVIAGEKEDMVKAIMEYLSQKENENHIKERLLKAAANGSKFMDTVMLGQLPLSVAALTLNKIIATMLIDNGANLKEENEDKETVFHSLIRYAGLHVDKYDNIWKMIKLLNNKMSADDKSIWHACENRDRLTPLKLAASLGLEKLFLDILMLEGVYRSINHHRGVSGVYLCDVTEIDTVTQAELERYKSTINDGETNENVNHPKLRHRSPAVLKIICQLPTKQAFPFLYMEVIKEAIRSKWRHYKRFFYAWVIFHLVIMIHITTLAAYKTDVLIDSSHDVNMTGVNNTTDMKHIKKRFVDASAGFTIVYASFYLLLELIRSFYFRQKWQLTKIHHNGPYRLMLTIFSLALIIDAIWYYVHPKNNYFLILALITGWTFMIFFLRAFKRFSFFTTMCLHIVTGDLTRLSLLICFQLLGFLTAIYITYRNSRDPPPGFENYALALVTMFKVMLGLAELDFLYEARESWLAVGLYLAFVLVFYVTLINSLIAMMSRTCGMISRDRYQQWKLQRLSVLLILETMLMPEWRHLPLIDRDELEHYSMEIQPFRFYLEITDTKTQKNFYDPFKTYIQKPSWPVHLGVLNILKRPSQANNAKKRHVDRPYKGKSHTISCQYEAPWTDNISWQFQELDMTRTCINSIEKKRSIKL